MESTFIEDKWHMVIIRSIQGVYSWICKFLLMWEGGTWNLQFMKINGTW
jgi:hypothetical protein